jgi:hypothetical protein
MLQHVVGFFWFSHFPNRFVLKWKHFLLALNGSALDWEVKCWNNSVFLLQAGPVVPSGSKPPQGPVIADKRYTEGRDREIKPAPSGSGFDKGHKLAEIGTRWGWISESRSGEVPVRTPWTRAQIGERGKKAKHLFTLKFDLRLLNGKGPGRKMSKVGFYKTCKRNRLLSVGSFRISSQKCFNLLHYTIIMTIILTKTQYAYNWRVNLQK